MKVRNRRDGAEGVYVGRPSPLGNPFRVGEDGSREEVIAKYKRWLCVKIHRRDEAVMKELANLREGDTLVCWCYPLPCHADVIVSAWRYCKEQGLI